MRHTVPIIRLEDESTPVERASRPDGACLVKIYPAVVSGSLIPLDRDEYVFGRDSECEYELTDDFASRRHAAFRWHGCDCFVVDLGSMNGTFVNNERVTQQQLHNGDQVRIGSHIFKFLVSDQVEALYHEAVFEMMTVDALTQTYNRRYFDDVFNREVSRSLRHKRSLGLLMLDIDNFKQHNDTYGHLVGDELLSGMCERISNRVRGDEVFARIGGEEFALAVVESSKEGLDAIGTQLCDLVSQEPFQTSHGEVELTISAGGAHTRGLEPITPKELFEAADANLYRAKQSGRNQYCG